MWLTKRRRATTRRPVTSAQPSSTGRWKHIASARVARCVSSLSPSNFSDARSDPPSRSIRPSSGDLSQDGSLPGHRAMKPSAHPLRPSRNAAAWPKRSYDGGSPCRREALSGRYSVCGGPPRATQHVRHPNIAKPKWFMPVRRARHIGLFPIWPPQGYHAGPGPNPGGLCEGRRKRRNLLGRSVVQLQYPAHEKRVSAQRLEVGCCPRLSVRFARIRRAVPSTPSCRAVTCYASKYSRR